MTRELHLIARDIVHAWNPVHFAARPYLDAMLQLHNVRGNFGSDSGRSIVLYFLSNATSWRGPAARALKAELREALK